MPSNQSQSSHGHGSTGGHSQGQGQDPPNMTSRFSSSTDSTSAASNTSGRPASDFPRPLSQLGAWSDSHGTPAPAYTEAPPTFDSKDTSQRNSAAAQGSLDTSEQHPANYKPAKQPNRYSGTGFDAQGNPITPSALKTYTPTGSERANTTGSGSASGRSQS